MEQNVLIIGSGPMAIDYAKVLIAQNVTFKVVGRGEKSASKFEATTGVKPFVGGLQKYLEEVTLSKNTHSIITTGTEALMPSLLMMLNAGVYKVLIEKPAALSIEELLQNEDKFKSYSENIYVAYNRRFYASIIEAQKMIIEDGGLRTMHFEFTEWSHAIEPLTKAPGVKENWFFANSTHVVDLAFFLAGKPVELYTFSQGGSLNWHNKTNFTGAGITEKGVLFSYLSNWESAGRWAVELLTDRRRIYLKPLESISIQMKGSIDVIEHAFDNTLDLEYKFGLHLQIKAFLGNENGRLLNIHEHTENAKRIYLKILS
mgnify:CR=1 FL=1